MSTHRILSLLLVVALLAPAALLAQADAVSDEAKRLFRQALEFNDRRDYANALTYFMQAYKEAPAILAADDRGLLDNVTSHLQARVDADPTQAEPHYQLAELLVLRGMDTEALVQYREVVRLAPGGPLAALAAGEIRRLETRAAQLRAAVAPVGAPTGGGSGDQSQTADLVERVTDLQAEVERLQSELAAARRDLEEAQRDSEEAKAEATKVRKQFEQLEQDAKRWKLYYNLYFANPQNYQKR